jgi:hypothetical protein
LARRRIAGTLHGRGGCPNRDASQSLVDRPQRGKIMTNSKDENGESPFKSDLERNPGIGQSKGSFATGVPPEEIEGENTVEGDVEND